MCLPVVIELMCVCETRSAFPAPARRAHTPQVWCDGQSSVFEMNGLDVVAQRLILVNRCIDVLADMASAQARR